MKTAKNKLVNILANIFARFLPIKNKKEDKKNSDFKHSAEKIGVSQNEKVKNSFRCRWLKSSK